MVAISDITARTESSEDDRRAMEETIYLTSISGMTISIKNGMKETASRAAQKIDL